MDFGAIATSVGIESRWVPDEDLCGAVFFGGVGAWSIIACLYLLHLDALWHFHRESEPEPATYDMLPQVTPPATPKSTILTTR